MKNRNGHVLVWVWGTLIECILSAEQVVQHGMFTLTEAEKSDNTCLKIYMT